MTPPRSDNAGRGAGALAWCAANRHFLVAAALLGATAAAWSALTRRMGVWVIKEPVGWPAGVEVDGQFRMTSLPRQMGTLEMVQDVEIRDDMMEQLKIGHHSDKSNRPRRCSGWLVARVYRDRAVPAGAPFALWRLEAYYYTGGADVVPHVPEVCLAAGGADIVAETSMAAGGLAVVPPGHEAWKAPINFHVVRYTTARGQGVHSSYYVFSLNGVPESRRLVVRWKLANPFVRHAYFVKIQFEPLDAAGEVQRADEAAARFARTVLPELLKALPTASEVARLDREGP